MPHCASCGAELSGRFCAICGAAASDPSAAKTDVPPVYTPPPPPPPRPPGPAPSAHTDIPENVASALTYSMGALSGVLFLVLEPYNRNPLVRFHAFQSIFVSVGVFVLWFAMLIATGVLALVPYVGLALGGAMLGLFGLAWLALWILLMVRAYQGERWKVPVAGDLAEKQAYTN